MSGACCLIIGFFYGGSALLLLVLASVWGATVVADSAQFSACVTELGDPRYLGTALTMQTCIGFLITTVSIGMMPRLVNAVGWEWAFVALYLTLMTEAATLPFVAGGAGACGDFGQPPLHEAFSSTV